MDGDMLSMAFQMVKEYGLEETLKIFLNILPENPSLIAVQKGFRNVVHGDHLIYKTAMGWNIHFYVVDNLGDGSLRVCGCFLEGNNNLFIEEELIFKPGQAQEIKIGERVLHEAGVMQKLKKKRYEQTLSFYNEDCHINEFKKQESGYDFLHNNSEHFVNFVKTGEPKCQITMEIENFIKDHILVQAIRNCSQMVKVITVNGNWAAIIKALCEAILNNSGVKSAIQEAIKDILKEVAKVSSNQVNGNINASLVTEREKSTAGQAEVRPANTEAVKEEERVATVQATKSKATAAGVTKRAAKEVVKKGRKATPTKLATKRVVRVGGKTTTVLATRSMPSRLVKEGENATTVQTARSTTKAIVRPGGKATALQATKGERKRVVKEAGKASILQATKSPAKPVVKAGGKAATFHTTKSAIKVNAKVGGKTTRLQATKGMSAKEHVKEVKIATGGKATTVQEKEIAVKKRTVKRGGTATTAQVAKCTTKEDVKETGKAVTIQPIPNAAEGAVKEEQDSTVQATTSSNEEIIKETENATAIQNKSTLKEEGEEIASDDEIVNEGKRATAVQVTKSAATVAMQEASKHAIKHGAHQTTMQVAKNAAANAMKHTLNATVIAGLVVEGTFYTVNMGKAMYKHSQGEMNDEEFTDFAVEQTAQSGGSAAGGISGSLAGVAAGAAVGSIVPGIGTVIGGTIGGFLGGVGGGFGGTLLGKEFGKLINYERKKEDNIDQMSDKPKFE